MLIGFNAVNFLSPWPLWAWRCSFSLYVTVKVWSSDWKLQFVFVGHTKTVTDLAVYPWGPQFMSVSDDDTLRVWNLEVFDQVDKYVL